MTTTSWVPGSSSRPPGVTQASSSPAASSAASRPARSASPTPSWKSTTRHSGAPPRPSRTPARRVYGTGGGSCSPRWRRSRCWTRSASAVSAASSSARARSSCLGSRLRAAAPAAMRIVRAGFSPCSVPVQPARPVSSLLRDRAGATGRVRRRGGGRHPAAPGGRCPASSAACRRSVAGRVQRPARRAAVARWRGGRWPWRPARRGPGRARRPARAGGPWCPLRSWRGPRRLVDSGRADRGRRGARAARAASRGHARSPPPRPRGRRLARRPAPPYRVGRRPRRALAVGGALRPPPLGLVCWSRAARSAHSRATRASSSARSRRWISGLPASSCAAARAAAWPRSVSFCRTAAARSGCAGSASSSRTRRAHGRGP